MKELLCFLFLFLISCNSSNQIEEIEILTYYNNAREFKIYSTIDKSGFTQTLYKTESNYIDNCQSRIQKSLIDSIRSLCKNNDEENFIFKGSKKRYLVYCGNQHSVRITYESGKKLMFIYPFANNDNKQFIPFQSLLREIQNDSLNATRLDIGQYGKLRIKQDDLSNLTFEKDSIRNAKAKYWKKKV